MSDTCLYCKQDQDEGQYTSDNEFLCDECTENLLGDDDE